jgi:hypothetical protein
MTGLTGLSNLAGSHPLLDLLLRVVAIALVSSVILLLLPALANAAG